jgi:hypothetical protein
MNGGLGIEPFPISATFDSSPTTQEFSLGSTQYYILT